MPTKFASKAQSAAFHAEAEGRGTIGIPHRVALKAVKENKGRSLKGLPKYVRMRGKKR
jgi:hypothetical protein